MDLQRIRAQRCRSKPDEQVRCASDAFNGLHGASTVTGVGVADLRRPHETVGGKCQNIVSQHTIEIAEIDTIVRLDLTIASRIQASVRVGFAH